jgi:hypothetical protein
VDTYTRRATRAFSFLWSFLALVIVAVGVLLGAVTEPAPDFFIIAFGVLTAFGGGALGFMHGVTLSAARNLDAAHQAEVDEERVNAPRCYDEYCAGDSVCPDRHR